eukprot:TRINITY_DN3623_c0_g1_i1.p1 TRINITY_DN3623_c0_g1~~TRINITY_DN3623_c0_g1_i1.p1  ORF type:complete len:149 (-),score=34.60 TRINITY_DN3623_c0_g1_i1:26-472(-)
MGLGVGMGAALVLYTTLLSDGVAGKDFAGASGMHTFARTLGSSIAPVFASMMMSVGDLTLEPPFVTVETTLYRPRGFRAAYALMLAVTVCAFPASLLVTNRRSVFCACRAVARFYFGGARAKVAPVMAATSKTQAAFDDSELQQVTLD